MIGTTAFQRLLAGGGNNTVTNNAGGAPDSSGLNALTGYNNGSGVNPNLPGSQKGSGSGVSPMTTAPGVPSTGLQSLFGGGMGFHNPISAYRAFRR